MKTKVCFFIEVIAAFFLLSCGDNELLETKNLRSSESITKSVLESKCNANYFVNDEGALVFATLDDYGFLIDSISKLTDNEFANWENQIGFESYRTFTGNLIDNVDNLETLQSLHPKYFEKNEKYDVVLPKIQSQVYRSIVNKDGFFYIGDTKNKVEGGFFSVEGQKVDPKLRQRVSYGLGNEEQIGNAIEYPSIEYVKLKSYKVMTWFRIFKIRGTNGSQIYYSTVLEITVRPRSWGDLIGWSDTQSTCHVEEVKVNMKGLGGCMFYNEYGNNVFAIDEFMSLKTISSSSASKLWTLSIHMNGMSPYDPGTIQDPYCVHYRARIDKIGKTGAAYNTHHPATGTGDVCALHKQVTEYQNVIYDK